MKAAIVEHFRDDATILIATEAAAEGVNLQFCSLVVNYDLPWNPQRIEQRIGRCHRYGQKHDVVVVNFLNRRNEADQRVFELLSEKFRLFDGVFGASDEVLGALESGVDIERRIAEVYQNCRTSGDPGRIRRSAGRTGRPDPGRMAETRQALLENFDEDVHSRLKVSREKTFECLSQREQWLLSLDAAGVGRRGRVRSSKAAVLLHGAARPHRQLPPRLEGGREERRHLLPGRPPVGRSADRDGMPTAQLPVASLVMDYQGPRGEHRSPGTIAAASAAGWNLSS